MQNTKIKVVILGNESVGKTSLITRYVYKHFNTETHPTIGVDFLSMPLKVSNECTIQLQIWDTAGQEVFRSLIPSYIKDSVVIVLVFDITNEGSFEDMPRWVEYIEKNKSMEPVVILVGNKIDMAQNRKVGEKDIQTFKEEKKIKYYFETSAKTGENIEKLFLDVFKDIGPGTPKSKEEIDIAQISNSIENNCFC